MTSEIDVIKTNEFLRRRKLRLQQVREQSKDIAKKIRQRAKVEKLRHVVEVDSKQEKEYFECQEKLVMRLEHLYAKGLQNVGSGHNNALEATQQDIEEKIDVSKTRGREAVAELRKKKQNKLDEQKKILDRKLQAREVANEISREKSNTTKNLVTKSSKVSDQEKLINDSDSNQVQTIPVQDNIDNPDAARNDMGTQWERADLPTEWEHVPALSLPKDDSVKDLIHDKLDKSKRINLFALSDEMPSSLRGGLSSSVEGTAPLKPSLTLVSDYLQNRNLRLREPDPSSSKKSTEDLRSIRQTILRTRATKTDGSVLDTVCHVLDEQVIPVPSWQAGDNFILNSSKHGHGPHCLKSSKTPNIKLPTSPRSLYRQLQSSPHCLDFSKKVKGCKKTFKLSVSGAKDKSSQSAEPEISLLRKKSISVYNHITRDVHDIPCNDEGMVIRDNRTNDDAYAQAYKETTLISNMEKEQLNKRQRDLRNKVAITRQNVDKEYKDTLAFLNSLPKDTGSSVIKTAYMNDDQQQLQKDKHQRKMQQEFKKIEKECSKNSCKHSKRKPIVPNHRITSRSPVNSKSRKDFEYSWMPVPESDGTLAIHTIPTKNKPGNSVKFGQDSYHEYRSRHKHTPPTKDNEKKRVLETVIVQNNSSNESSVSETSSVEDLSLEKTKEDSKLKDAERIIIYKILESKKDKKKHTKLEGKSKSIADDDIRLSKKDDNKNQKVKSFEIDANVQTGVSFEHLKEGVYKVVNQNGQSYNVTSCYTADVEMWQSTTERKPWWDNITSMYYKEDEKLHGMANRSGQKNKTDQSCCTNNSHVTQPDRDQQDEGDNQNRAETRRLCKCDHNISKDSGLVQPSAATSTSSFKTATNDKANRYVPEPGFLKFIDEGGQESGKFYIGASGFIKDDDYEVVIQLRKKEGERVKNISGSINKEIKETLNNASKTTLSENIEPNKVIEQGKELDVSINLVEDKFDLSLKRKQEISEQKELQKNQMETKGISPKINMVPTTCEKAVHTSFKDTNAIPDNVTKCDPVSRPATSTYTQTSFNSSIQRPVFMQMSSSTSTAYMSPPDLVLPKLLRQDHVLSYEDTYDSENTLNIHQYVTKQYRCKNKECTCKRCACNNDEIFKIGFKNRNKMKTPPNTARSARKCDSTSEISYKECKKPKCPKCFNRRNSSSKHSVCYKSHRNKSIHSLKRKSLKNLTHADQLSSTTQTPQQKLFHLNTNNKMTNATLNPTVKKYVNQLLSLNRDGHKAIEIINQDCSNVTTPGSSIINVTCNAAKDSTLQNKISLEDLKNILKQRILRGISNQNKVTNTNHVKNTESQTEKKLRLPKKKSVHKVKSLNISKRLQKKNKPISSERLKIKTPLSSSSSCRELPLDKGVAKTRSKSSPTPRSVENSEYINNTSSDGCDTTEPTKRKGSKYKIINRQLNSQSSASMGHGFRFQQRNQFSMPIQRATTPPPPMSSDSGLTSFLLKNMNQSKLPTNTCTQTNEIIDAETNFMKLAENKIQNMEKIADLTEKCTKRLSNLAKVLEEVRRNKSSAYSQITTSDSASESDNISGKHKPGHLNVCLSDPNVLVESKTNRTSSNSPIISTKLEDKEISDTNPIQFPSFLKDIPKPDFFKSASNTSLSVTSEKSDQDTQVPHTPYEQGTIKYRGRPPPALKRVNLKNGQDALIIPHELSTVVEVDSPMSLKIKNQSSHAVQLELPNKLNDIADLPQENLNITPDFRSIRESQINPDILQSNLNLSKRHSKISSTDSSDDSKIRMMDMKQFNDIMLKPFISLQEYAKQCNIGLDDGSNTEDFLKDDPRNDELSSLHSDGSLPDVIAELLKRNIIAEPFKFDSASNINSTTLSSESTISMLALSKVRKEKKKNMFFKNKENIVETSETLSISSNPDLEKAFQKLGMGWASSTLKKTKERLALSSSSSASSSSMSQFKIKSFSQNVPTLGTDSTSSLIDTSITHDRKKSLSSKHPTENAKNAIQQTSLTNSMTVKEFLTNELAKKITFNNKSTRKEAEEQFVSLYETKMPEDLKNTQDREDESSVASPNNNRARTSTPVQIFKSTTYRSTSSSNTSNGLFSNADELSSVKGTSNSVRNHSTSDKDDLTIPNCSLKTKKELSDRSKSD